MSASNPASVNAASSAGRSPGSQRVPLSASGRMMQARVLAVSSEEELQPVKTSDVAAARQIIVANDLDFIWTFLVNNSVNDP
jgi:hypothetical protein